MARKSLKTEVDNQIQDKITIPKKNIGDYSHCNKTIFSFDLTEVESLKIHIEYINKTEENEDKIFNEDDILIWELNGEQQKCKIYQGNDANKRYVIANLPADEENEVNDSDVKLKLVENNDQLKDIKGNIVLTEIEELRKHNFNRTIFVKNVTFSHLDIKSNILFNSAIFLSNVCFDGINFYKEVKFDRAIFLSEVVFSYVNFESKISFWDSKFNRQVNFYKVKFKKETSSSKNLDFSSSRINTISFLDTSFENSTDFSYSRIDTISFLDTSFENSTDFSDSKINKISFEKTTFNEGYLTLNRAEIESLNLKFTNLKNLEIIGTKIKNSDNRETFLILKNFAMSYSDNIKALEYYTKEMNKHLEELSFTKNPVDKIILCFEKHISNFGTDVSKAIEAFILFHLYVFAISIWIFQNKYDTNEISINIYKLNLFAIAKEPEILLYIFTTIVSSILIYEIIKSFRKYSRKL